MSCGVCASLDRDGMMDFLVPKALAPGGLGSVRSIRLDISLIIIIK